MKQTSDAPPSAPDADFALVGALTRLSWDNTLACQQAEPRLIPILEAAARAADEAARHIQYGRLDQLDERQQKLVAACKKDLTS